MCETLTASSLGFSAVPWTEVIHFCFHDWSIIDPEIKAKRLQSYSFLAKDNVWPSSAPALALWVFWLHKQHFADFVFQFWSSLLSLFSPLVQAVALFHIIFLAAAVCRDLRMRRQARAKGVPCSESLSVFFSGMVEGRVLPHS